MLTVLLSRATHRLQPVATKSKALPVSLGMGLIHQRRTIKVDRQWRLLRPQPFDKSLELLVSSARFIVELHVVNGLELGL